MKKKEDGQESGLRREKKMNKSYQNSTKDYISDKRNDDYQI